MRSQPIVFVWKAVFDIEAGAGGEQVMAMVPTARYRNVAIRQFGEIEGEHVLEPVAHRSAASHNHYFAALNDAWANLPEDEAWKYPNLDHFRKALLVACNYIGTTRSIACVDNEAAVRVAQAVRAMEIEDSIFASVYDNVVLLRTAKSQSLKAMGKEEFEASKKAVLDMAATLIGVRRGDLTKQAGRSA